jgi:outer membrane protein OmpA-like peptidoglycan-associated protein
MRHRDLARARRAGGGRRDPQSEIAQFPRDMMVEALYPITGRLVAAAVAEAFRESGRKSMNARLDALLSSQAVAAAAHGSWFTGRKPVSEVALAEAQRAELQRILFLERHSGRLIASWARETEQDKPEIVSGLIAAITDFAADVLAAQGGELRTLDLGGASVALRSSARMIVAAQYRGKARPEQERALDALFTALLAAHERDDAIDPALLADEARTFSAVAAEPAKTGGPGGKIVLALAALALVGWGAWSALQATLNWRKERAVAEAAEALATARPQTAAFPLHFSFDHSAQRLSVRGLLPSREAEADLRARIDAAAAPYAVAYQTALPVSQDELAARDARLRELQSALAARETQIGALEARLSEADRRAGALAGRLDAVAAAPPDARLVGRIEADRARFAEFTARHDAPFERLMRLARTAAVFFGEDDRFLEPEAAQRTIDAMAEAVKAADASLRVVGHSDSIGAAAANRRLGEARAKAVIDALTRAGVAPEMLRAASRADGQLIGPPRAPANRRVTFEPILASEPAP